jgi:two-component system, LuxR family, sensor kinase FixL
MPIKPKSDLQSESRLLVSHGVIAIGFAVISYGATLAGHAVHLSSDNVASLWLTHALLLAVLIMRPYQEWWRFLILSAVAQLATNFTLYPTGESWAGTASLGGLSANLLEPIVGAVLVRRYLDAPSDLLTLRGLCRFLLVTSGIAAIVGATVGVMTTHFLYPDTPRSIMFLRWVTADAIGTALLVPPLLSWFAFSEVPPGPRRPTRWLEGIAFTFIAGAAPLYIFFLPPRTAAGFLDLPYALFPFLIWAIVRFQVRVALTLCLFIGLAAATGTASGLGPWVAHGGSVPNGAAPLQFFLAIMVIGILIVCALMQEREQAMRQLLESEERFRLALETAGSGGWDLDMSSGKLYFSDRLFDLSGYEREPARETLDFFASILHPDDIDALRAALVRHLKGEAPIFECDCRILCHDGSYRWMLARGQVTRCDASGRAERLTGASIDIMERKQTEAALRGSEKRYRTLVEGSLQGIVILDSDDRCVFANTALAHILGYEHAQDLVGQVLSEHLTPRDLVRIQRYRQARLQGDPAPNRYELQAIRQDGTLCWLEVLSSPFDWEEQTARMATVIDISEQKRLQQELINLSEHEQRRLSRELHDSLGQLLTGTALFSRLLADKLATKGRPEATEAAQVADWIQQAVGTTHDVAHGLYPEALASHGLQTALEALVAQTAQLFGITCRLEGSIPDDLLSLSAALHLYRIVQESLTNAVKHGQATSVVIQLEMTSEHLCMRVQDNGTGMPQDVPPGGMGQRNMQTRAALLDATLSIGSTATGGTQVTLQIPLSVPVQV